MNTLKILDLFCGEGGAAKGYFDALSQAQIKFKIIGIDKDSYRLKRYPFESYKYDAFQYLILNWRKFDFIHASPPCQGYTKSLMKNKRKKYLEAFNQDRFLKYIRSLNVPNVLENVPQSLLRKDIILTGSMFGKKYMRERVFELNNLFLMQPIIRKRHNERNQKLVSVAGNVSAKFANETLELGWCSRKGAVNAVPPIYTKYIMENIINQLTYRG